MKIALEPWPWSQTSWYWMSRRKVWTAGQVALLELIVSLHQAAGLTVLLSTHNLTLVANSAHNLMILQADNAVCEVGKTATLLATERLRQIYGVELGDL